MLSPPTVGRKMQICTLIHKNLESQTPSLFTIHSKASLCISRYALGRACDERKQGKNGVVEGSERVSESERGAARGGLGVPSIPCLPKRGDFFQCRVLCPDILNRVANVVVGN